MPVRLALALALTVLGCATPAPRDVRTDWPEPGVSLRPAPEIERPEFDPEWPPKSTLRKRPVRSPSGAEAVAYLGRPLQLQELLLIAALDWLDYR